jgi:tellurite resistance protein TerC
MDLRTEMWLLFLVIVLVSLAIDLGLPSHRHRTHDVSIQEAMLWTCIWIGLSLLFNVVVYVTMGAQRGTEFLTAYLVEKSLSVDNMFVFMLIFDYFKIPGVHQPKVLKYGILGAVLMRFVLIFTGVKLLERFHALLYVFGAILIITAIQMIRDEGKDLKPEANWALRFFQRFLPFGHELHEGEFLIQDGARWVATPLLATLLVIEASDLLFAVDSIPAVLAISRDPFIVFSSNVFAILGLRSLYFVLHGVMGLFHYLKYGLGVVLIFIGIKMLLTDVFPIHTAISLGVVALCLAVSIACSVWLAPSHE